MAAGGGLFAFFRFAFYRPIESLDFLSGEQGLTEFQIVGTAYCVSRHD
jgi:hypothetical protein